MLYALQAPINDHQAATGLIGLRPSTKNAHIVRAILQSIAFRVAQLYACTQNETDFSFSIIRCVVNLAPAGNYFEFCFLIHFKLISCPTALTVASQKMISFANFWLI